jgi:hypothetical protein
MILHSDLDLARDLHSLGKTASLHAGGCEFESLTNIMGTQHWQFCCFNQSGGYFNAVRDIWMGLGLFRFGWKGLSWINLVAAMIFFKGG